MEENDEDCKIIYVWEAVDENSDTENMKELTEYHDNEDKGRVAYSDKEDS